MDYHLLIGVEHFVMISNECNETDFRTTLDIIQPYVAEGKATFIDTFRCANSFQVQAYKQTYNTLFLRDRLAKW
jgi:hypothetical protein